MSKANLLANLELAKLLMELSDTKLKIYNLIMRDLQAAKKELGPESVDNILRLIANGQPATTSAQAEIKR